MSEKIVGSDIVSINMIELYIRLKVPVNNISVISGLLQEREKKNGID